MPHYIINPKTQVAFFNPGDSELHNSSPNDARFSGCAVDADLFEHPDRLKGELFSPIPQDAGLYNTKVRYFPENRIRISCFSRPVYNPDGLERITDPGKKKPSLTYYDPVSKEILYREVPGETILNPFTGKVEPFKVLKEQQARRSDSIKRSIDKAFEIGFSNNFRYFITLTLDKDKIDRYDKSQIYPKLKNWLSNNVSRHNMDYILFPEYHKLKEGEETPAIHFHALANAENLSMTDSGRKTKRGQTIYNLDGWKYGFSTVIELDGRPAIIAYVAKYITKGNESILGKFYLSGGKTLQREVPCEYMNRDYATFDGQEYQIPDANLSVKYRTYDLGPFLIDGEDDELLHE